VRIGGYLFLVLVAIGCVMLAGEWVAMCGYSASDPGVFWMPAVLVSAAVCAGLGAAAVGLLLVSLGSLAALFWVRLAPSRQDAACFSPGGSAPGGSGPGGSGPGGSGPGGAGTTAAIHAPARQRRKRDLAFGLPYLGLAAVALPWLRSDPAVGLGNTFFVLAIVWASDIGAYLVGRLAGGPKLAPAISPGKTWSGAAGGLICGVLGGMAVAACVSPEISVFHVIEPGIGLGIISQAGDLLESAIKRHFGVKDSGRIIPGHGGLLDRLDALLAVAPVAALLAFTLGRGVVLWR
jgi:phosphatidate cytidylyltransferase